MTISDEDDRGVWASEHEYIASQVAEHLPDFLSWLPACCDPDKLRAGYQGRALVVWSIPIAINRVMVFESIAD